MPEKFERPGISEETITERAKQILMDDVLKLERQRQMEPPSNQNMWVARDWPVLGATAGVTSGFISKELLGRGAPLIRACGLSGKIAAISLPFAIAGLTSDLITDGKFGNLEQQLVGAGTYGVGVVVGEGVYRSGLMLWRNLPGKQLRNGYGYKVYEKHL